MASTALGFTIFGQDGVNSRSATRKSASSAAVLADRWAREGLTNITLTCPAGVVLGRSAFRATLPLKKLLKAGPNLR